MEPLSPLLARLAHLAAEQLRAYNAADLDAFCACYAPDVEVLDEGGARVLVGIEAFRERYRARFEGGQFGASVVSRALALGAPGCAPGEGRCVDEELWWREGAGGREGGREEGRVWACYFLGAPAGEEGRALIGRVRFYVEGAPGG